MTKSVSVLYAISIKWWTLKDAAASPSGKFVRTAANLRNALGATDGNKRQAQDCESEILGSIISAPLMTLMTSSYLHGSAV